MNTLKGRSFTTSLIDQLNNNLVIKKTHLLNKLYFNKLSSSSDIIITQFLSETLLGLMFKRVLFFCISKEIAFIYPLPKNWIIKIEQNGINCNKFLCISLYLLLSFIF